MPQGSAGNRLSRYEKGMLSILVALAVLLSAAQVYLAFRDQVHIRIARPEAGS